MVWIMYCVVWWWWWWCMSVVVVVKRLICRRSLRQLQEEFPRLLLEQCFDVFLVVLMLELYRPHRQGGRVSVEKLQHP